MIKKLSNLFLFTLVTILMSPQVVANNSKPQNTTPKSTPLIAKVFDYKTLADHSEEIQEYLHEHGFIAIRGVPGFTRARAKFLKACIPTICSS